MRGRRGGAGEGTRARIRRAREEGKVVIRGEAEEEEEEGGSVAVREE